MAEANGRTAAERTLSPGNQRKIAVGVAGTIAAIAILFAILIARRTPQYEAHARLAYTATGPGSLPVAELPSGSGAATTLATRIFDDRQLAQFIDRYDLYPKLRQQKPTSELSATMRSDLILSEPEAGTLQVSFRDEDQQKSTAVTNGLAALLTQYEATARIPSPAPVARIKRGGHHQNFQPQIAITQAPASQGVAELTHQVDRVDDTLQDLESSKAELATEQKQVDAKIANLEKAERRTAARAAQPAVHDERAEIEQQLADKKVKLAALLDRYTEAYPDVQRAEGDIATLEGRLSGLPAASAPATPEASEQAAAMEKLKQERQRIERDVSRNEAAVAAEQERKAGLLADIDHAKTRPARVQGPAASVLPTAAPAMRQTASASFASSASLASGDTIAIPVFPFRLTENAGDAAQVNTSRLTLDIWLAFATIVLLAICFVPLVPAHYAAVVTTAEDMQQGMPDHVAYLGDVGRTEF